MANQTFQERTRRANVLPITLGPHGSNFSDVVEAMSALIDLDKGYTMTIDNPNLKINGEVKVYAHTMTYIGDMPQQQANSGNKSQRATRGCRFCYITEDERGNLDYDIITNGRFHFQVQLCRCDRT